MSGNGRYLGRFRMCPASGAKTRRQARLGAVKLAEQAGSALGSTGATLEE
ncbi:hypothetical protein [Streptomyces silvisoli]|uniref:Site-specific integrase n=1 Tax=Streptomyces silvisoli TaxID=3034235 RepID=A0ABT5ZUN9_9ACTN|nr:hypothetical protein [Streptomyces silvisoli]MDF3293535.1 hypothetical protein [Streptomyces silvisoli]